MVSRAPSGKPRSRLALLAPALLLLAAAACRAPRPRPFSTLVLVTVDTLRADRLGPYGSRSTRTPVVDGLGAEGLTFLNAAAPMPITRPSHLTMLTSLYPRTHGVVNNMLSLPGEFVTLPQVFRKAGFKTGGFVGVNLLSPGSGAGRGFEHFDFPSQIMRPAQDVVPLAVSWLRQLRPEERVFLWLHLFDPHLPYEPPAPAGAPPDAIHALSWELLEASAAQHGGDLPAAVRDRATYLYDREVEHADAWTGRLFDALKQAGRWEQSAVLFTADHGECFENGVFFEHAECLYEGAIRVPLILRAPGWVAKGQRAPQQVEHLDIAPTLLELAGLEPPAQFSGRSLLRADRAEWRAFLQFPIAERRQVARRNRRRDTIHSVAGVPFRRIERAEEFLGVRTTRWKFFQGMQGPELYDLQNDPLERKNLAGSVPEMRDLRRRVAGWRESLPLRALAPEKLSPDAIEQLEALGYIQ
jgi:arylsulfatase A-like enzyme